MRKIKVNPATSSMKKTSSKDDKKVQLNSLIKVLRPKVYITDSSSFKTLVQQLTGNGDITNNNSNILPIQQVSSPPPPQPQPQEPFANDQTNVFNDNHPLLIENNIQDYQIFQESSEEFSVEESSEGSFANHHQTDFSQLREVESWLLEGTNNDQFPIPYYPPIFSEDAHHDQEVCVYDYDLSGFM